MLSKSIIGSEIEAPGIESLLGIDRHRDGKS